MNNRPTTTDQIFSALMDAVVLQGGMSFRAIALGIQPQDQAALMWLQSSEVWRKQETKMYEFIQDSESRGSDNSEYPFLLVTSTVKGQPDLERAGVKESFNEAAAQYDDSRAIDEADAKSTIVLPERTITYFAPEFFGERLDIMLYAGIFGSNDDDNKIAMDLFADMLGTMRNDEIAALGADEAYEERI